MFYQLRSKVGSVLVYKEVKNTNNIAKYYMEMGSPDKHGTGPLSIF